MISNLNEYITKYMLEMKNTILPGEHHFVSVYLLPKIWKVTGQIPVYVNPDGTKKLPGDLVYEKNQVSFEAKYKKIMFTRTQWESWFNLDSNWNSKDKVPAPGYFVGLCEKGIVIRTWKEFVTDYLEILTAEKKIDLVKYKIKMYSPQVVLEKYLEFVIKRHGSEDIYFYSAENSKTEGEIEDRIREIFA